MLLPCVICLDKLVKSLEDFFKKESDDMALLMNDVETESKGRAEFHYLHILTKSIALIRVALFGFSDWCYPG